MNTTTGRGWTAGKIGLGVLWAVLLVVGLAGLYGRLSTGHAQAGYGSYVPWGIWVALYFHGVGLAAGVFVAGALGYLRGVPGLAGRTALRNVIVLSLAALFPGLLAIGLDLGHFERAMHIFLAPDFSSVMTLNTWMYNLFMLAAAVAWLLSWRRESAWLKPWLGCGIALAFAYALGSGTFFSAVNVKPAWHDGIWPVITLVSGLTSGAALLLLVRALAAPADDAAGFRYLRGFTQGGIAAYLLLAGIHWVVLHAYAPPAESAVAVSAGLQRFEAGGVRWVLGGLVPLALLCTNSRKGWAFACLLVVVTFLGGRLDLVLAGQVPAELPALPAAFQHERLAFAYRPTAMELQVSLFLVAFGMAVYAVGETVNRLVAARTTPTE